MVARTHWELEAWQLADRVRRRFLDLTTQVLVKRDFAFCDDTRRAARSACRNLAEGFYRYRHPESAHFTNIAIGSLGELLDAADEAQANGYVDETAFKELVDLIGHAKASATALLQHLLKTPTPPRRPRRP
jgi:four helix bundle protein